MSAVPSTASLIDGSRIRANYSRYLFLISVSVVYLAVSLSLFLRWPPPWPDEAIFADTSRHILDGGLPATALVAGMEEGAFWQPPGWFYVAAPVIAVGGFDIVPMRLFSMVLGLVVIWLSLALALKAGFGPWTSRTAAMLLALTPLFVFNVKMARMDGLCMVFLLAGMLFYIRGSTGRARWGTQLAAVAFVLAMLTHPMGVLGPIVAGMDAVLGRRSEEHPASIVVGWMLGVVVLAWGLWFVLASGSSGGMEQLRFQLLRKTSSPGAHVAGFLERYRSFPILLLLIPPGVAELWRLTGEGRPRMLALAAGISLLAVIFSFELPYHVYYLPFVLLGVAAFLERQIVRGGWRKAVGIASLLALVVNLAAYTGYFNYQLNVRLQGGTDYRSFCAAIAQRLPASARVLLSGYPTPFWGLREAAPGVRMTDETCVNDSLGVALMRRVGWVVVSEAFRVDADRAHSARTLERLAGMAGRAGRELVPFARLGTQEDYAYRARVYRLQSRGSARSLP